MKHFLIILLALVSASYGQRETVMHTNGVIVSPTNLVIQQSNVAGLSNALTTKLDTNGSAAGLTGFVGTTNAETARGNLGISNTFAGQFHADFYDDFSRYSNGTQFTNGASPVIGSNYVLRSSTFNPTPVNDVVVPFITNGTLTGTNTETWYLSSELSRPVYNFGMEWTWETGKSANLTWPVIIIRPDDAWLNKLLHIVVQPNGIYVDVSVTNGAAGFVNIATTNFGSTGTLESGIKHILSGEIEGNTLRVKLGGRSLEVTDSRIGEVNGRFFTYEFFCITTTNNANIFWHRVWANSPNMMSYANQPFSQNLVDFANGDARVSRYLTVGTNKSAYNAELSTNIPVFIDGGMRAKGRVQGLIAGISYGSAPLTHFYNGASANTNTTNRNTLWERNLGQGVLSTAGQRWNVTAVGSFANNTNEKRVVFEMAGGSQLDTGNITDTGEWKVNAIIYRTDTNTHEAFAMFQSENTTKTARWTYNLDTTFGVRLQAAATSNNEVILRSAWADWYP
jgi:hypothetical protein